MQSRHTLSALALGLSLTLAGVSGCSAGDGMSVKGSSEAKELTKGASLNLDELRGFDNVTVTLDDVTTGADCAAKASNGQWVALGLTVKNNGGATTPGITVGQWTAVDAGGTKTEVPRMTGDLCAKPDQQFPLSFDGKDEVKGTLFLDVPEQTTKLENSIPHDTESGTLVISLN